MLPKDIQEIISRLRAYCHTKDCRQPEVCPAIHKECAPLLGDDTAMAWETAALLETIETRTDGDILLSQLYTISLYHKHKHPELCTLLQEAREALASFQPKNRPPQETTLKGFFPYDRKERFLIGKWPLEMPLPPLKKTIRTIETAFQAPKRTLGSLRLTIKAPWGTTLAERYCIPAIVGFQVFSFQKKTPIGLSKRDPFLPVSFSWHSILYGTTESIQVRGFKLPLPIEIEHLFSTRFISWYQEKREEISKEAIWEE